MLNRFNSNARKLNRVIPTKVNPETLAANFNTGSLENIQAPTTKFNSNTKSNPYPTKTVNSKNTIRDFELQILQNSAMSIKVKVDRFDNIANTLTISNMCTDYGTQGANSDNFEVMVYGLHIPGDYTVKDTPNGVVITLNDKYIDFDNITENDIYVIGKLRYL